MDEASRSSRLRTLLEGAWARDEPERTTWLRAACGDDAPLFERVAALVAEERLPAGFLTPPLDGVADEGLPGDGLAAGERIGPWRLERELGRGGMGTVWLASRADEAFERRVAIKVLRTPLLDRDMQLRFRRESVVQASLDHPGIARLLDSGVTEAGRPYLVLEHVDGRRIDRWCAEERPSLAARLELFARVCDAVHHAHRMLVVHRDLKPGNVLVTANGEPKLLDFGIAKLLQPGTDATWADLTREEQRLFTPSCASPEQLRGDPVGVASDVYSLGVLLYELLVGVPPLDLSGLAWTEMLRRLTDDVVRPPSEASGDRRLAGDVDAIVMTALRKEPERRYGSVEAFADDVRRHLAGLPVRARPDTLGYRASRFLKRNRVLASAAAAALLALVVGLVSTLVQFHRAEDARELAEQRLDESRRLATDLAAERTAAVARADQLARLSADLVAESERSAEIEEFVLGIFEVADPNQSRGETVTARELLDAGVERLRVDLRDQPATRADLLEVAGGIYTVLGLYDRAWSLAGEVRELREQVSGVETLEYARAVDALSELAEIRGDYDRATELAEQAIALRERLGDDEGLARSVTRLGRIRHLEGDLAGAERRYEEGLELHRRTVGELSPDVALGLSHLGSLRAHEGRPREAEELHRRAIAITEELFPEGHLSLAGFHVNLATALRQQNRFDEALLELERALHWNEEMLGPRHPDNAYVHHNRAAVFQDMRQWGRAEGELRASLAILREHFDEGHASVGKGLASLGRVLAEEGRDEEALEMLYRALDIVLAEVPGDPVLTEVFLQLGTCLLRRGDREEGERMLLESLALCDEHWGNDDYRTQNVLRILVDLYTAWDRPDEAARYRERVS